MMTEEEAHMDMIKNAPIEMVQDACDWWENRIDSSFKYFVVMTAYLEESFHNLLNQDKETKE